MLNRGAAIVLGRDVDDVVVPQIDAGRDGERTAAVVAQRAYWRHALGGRVEQPHLVVALTKRQAGGGDRELAAAGGGAHLGCPGNGARPGGELGQACRRDRRVGLAALAGEVSAGSRTGHHHGRRGGEQPKSGFPHSFLPELSLVFPIKL